MRSNVKAFAGLALIIAVATTLGACSLPPSPAPTPTSTATGESVSTACDALEGDARASSEAMVEGSKLLTTDATGSAEMLAAAAVRFDKAAAAVKNKKVGKLATDTSDSINALSDLVTAFAADPSTSDPDALPAAATDANTAFVALAEVCDWSPTADQSASAACDAFEGVAATVSSELSGASDLLSTDPTGAAEKLAAAAASFDEAATAVHNEKVGELARNTSLSLNRFSDLINALAADPSNPDTEALTAGSTDLNAAFNELASASAW